MTLRRAALREPALREPALLGPRPPPRGVPGCEQLAATPPPRGSTIHKGGRHCARLRPLFARACVQRAGKAGYSVGVRIFAFL